MTGLLEENFFTGMDPPNTRATGTKTMAGGHQVGGLAHLAASSQRLPAGNWMAEVSQASFSTYGGSFKGGKQGQGYGQSGNQDSEYHDCEPEFVRFSSIESEANTEALFRLFGRKPSNATDAATSKRVSALPQVCEEQGEMSSSRGPAAALRASILPRASVPVLDVPANGDAAEPSPRASVDSAGSCEEVEGGEVQSGSYLYRGDSVPSVAGSEADEERPQAHEPSRLLHGEDPTCNVDAFSWKHQSLQSILSGAAQPQAESQPELCPRELLESSLLDLIADPVVKAKIMSLQLFTEVSAPQFSCEPLVDTPQAPCEEAAAADRYNVNHGVEEEEACDSPNSREDSPPPLQRKFTGKRGSILEDCWLTGEQRKWRSAGPADGADEFAFDFLKRRRF